MSSDETLSFLPRELRGFVLELDRLEHEIRNQVEGRGPRRRELPGDGDPQAIRRSLADRLDRMEAAARQVGYDAKSPDFQQTRHVLASLADARLASFEWWGRDSGPELAAAYPLPEGVPQDLASQIDQLVAASPPKAALAEVYLLALTAVPPNGEGDEERERRLEDARRRLLDTVARRRPELTTPQGDALFPDAYVRTQRQGPILYLPDPLPWIVALTAVAAALATTSTLLWLGLAKSLRAPLAEILQLLR